MPITDIIDDKTYREYINGYRSSKTPTRFELAREHGIGRYSSEYPNPNIVEHAYECPHHHVDDYRIYDLVPEGYVNKITPECVDYHIWEHSRLCRHHHDYEVERRYIQYLEQAGTPAIYNGKKPHWYFHDQEVDDWDCPFCTGANPNRFAFCVHAEVPRKEVEAEYEAAKRGLLPTPECRIDPYTPSLGCHWGYWHICMERGPQWVAYTYEGCVLGEYERNMPDDSDFYAVVWDEDKQCVEHIEYATTRGYCRSYCRPDATPEVIEKALAYYHRSLVSQYMNASADEARMIRDGKAVVVVKAVKRGKNQVPLGMTGEVSSMQESEWGMRVCFVDDDQGERHWVSIDKVEVVDPENYVATPAEARAFADQAVDRMRHSQNYRTIGYSAPPGVISFL